MKYYTLYLLLGLMATNFTRVSSNPTTEAPKLPDPIIEHNYYWRDYRRTLPNDALEGAVGLYVGQVYCNGILPATFYPAKNEAITECRGSKIVVKYPIKILCDKRRENFVWEYINIDRLDKKKMEEMVLGGYEANQVLYIGKVFYEGEWRIGKVLPPPSINKGLTLWKNNTRSYTTHDFQILKYSNKPQIKIPMPL